MILPPPTKIPPSFPKKVTLPNFHCQITVPSDFEHISKVINHFNYLFQPVDIVGDRLDRLVLSLSEAANNALEHGNKFNQEKTTCISMRLCKNYLVIRVEDQGDGFNWRAIDMEKLPDVTKPNGRGLFLINKFMDKMIFNDKGNQVTMLKCLGKATSFQIQISTRGKMILARLLGVFDRENAKLFRTAWNSWISKGYIQVVVVLKNLEVLTNSGVRELLNLSRCLSEKGGGMRLCNTNDVINRSDCKAGPLKLFAEFDDTEGAIKEIKHFQTRPIPPR